MRVAPSLACIAAGFLGACSSFSGDNNPFTVFADPGQYQYHSCEQIARCATLRPSARRI